MLFYLLLLLCCVVSVTSLNIRTHGRFQRAQVHMEMNTKKMTPDNLIVAAIDNAEVDSWDVKWPAPSKPGPGIPRWRSKSGPIAHAKLLKPKAVKLLLLQTNTHTQHKQKQQVLPALPPVKLANPGVAGTQSPQQARTTIRGGINNDAAGLGADYGLYTFDASERVDSVRFM